MKHHRLDPDGFRFNVTPDGAVTLQGRRVQHPVYSTMNRSEPLHTYPSWEDSRFREAQTVFGVKESGLDYVYSDRLTQWDYEKDRAAREHAVASSAPLRSARWYETFLSFYFDRPVTLKHVLVGCNVATGYPYVVFGFRYADKKEP